MAAKKRSAFTDNIDRCFGCGARATDMHHIFNGPDRKKSDKYNFLIPLCRECHRKAHEGDPAEDPTNRFILRDVLQMMGQHYYEMHHGTRDDFRKEFRKSYL